MPAGGTAKSGPTCRPSWNLGFLPETSLWQLLFSTGPVSPSPGSNSLQRCGEPPRPANHGEALMIPVWGLGADGAAVA